MANSPSKFMPSHGYGLNKAWRKNLKNVPTSVADTVLFNFLGLKLWHYIFVCIQKQNSFPLILSKGWSCDTASNELTREPAEKFMIALNISVKWSHV